jgi:hypothetical protein
MNIKLTALSAGILAGFSAVATAQVPPTVPPIYNGGPQSPLLNTTNLSAAERSAFSLLEGVMQVTEAKIHATSCQTANFDVEVYADGSLGSNVPPNGGNSIFNKIKVTGANGSQAPQFELNANLLSPVAGRGQQVQVSLATPGFLGSSRVTQFNATYAFNNVNNMMVTNAVTIGIVGINGGLADIYTGNVIKDFYHGATSTTNPEYYNIYDWGLQSVSKLGYPVNKWWQRSKTHRDDGVVGRTVWVKDRLVGASPCRITIDTNGYNNQSYFWQGGSIGAGTLTIAPVAPAPDTTAWTEAPF